MAEVNLNTCPDCGHQLAHRPPGQCPACAFEFDALTRVWRSSRSWQHHFVYYALYGVVTGLLVTIAHRLVHGEAPNALLPIVAGLAVALAGLAFDRILAGRLSGRFIALTGSGVVVATRRRRQLFTWPEIHRLKTTGRVAKLELAGDAADVPLDDIFDTRAEVDEFRRAFDRLRSEH